MEKHKNEKSKPDTGIDWNLNGNSNSGNEKETAKLTDFPESNIGSAEAYPSRIDGSKSEKNVYRTIEEATDQSKLSDI